MTTTPRDKLTFSQAYGYEPLPSPLRLGELSHEVRNLIFARLYEALSESSLRHSYGRVLYAPWDDIVRQKHLRFDKRPIDEVDIEFDAVVKNFKRYCYEAPFHVLFSLLEFICRHHPGGAVMASRFNKALAEGRAAYRFNETGFFVEPVPTEEEGQAIQQAFEAVAAEEFAGARVHLRKAGMYLGQPGKEADSVRESIHAVEAVCKALTGDEAATLTEALKALKQRIEIHGALEGALSRLYGYTSDEQGIRHALVTGDSAVDAGDAQFMFGACASFVSYLIGKGKQAELIK